MVQHTGQSPQWWQVWAPLLLASGLLALEPQVSLSPGGHQVAQLLIVLLMYGIFLGWLWCYRGACPQEEYERKQAHEHARQTRQPRRELAMSTHVLWEDTLRSWHSRNGHNTDMLRRQ
jgi:hypothetical protein